MNAKKEIHDSEHNLPEGMGICPYLKWRNDETIRYGFPHVSNFCHKPKKAQPVRLSYQKPFCLTEKYTDCPVFQQEKITQLPQDIRGTNIFKRRIPKNIPLLMIILLLTLGIITVLIIISTSQLPSVGAEDTSTLSALPPQPEEIVPSGSSWNDGSSGKTFMPFLLTLSPLSKNTQNPSIFSATLSNNGIPATGSRVMENDRISSLELNSVITSGSIGNSTFIPDTIYSQNEDPYQVVYSDLSGKNLISTVVALNTLRLTYGYGLMYLSIP